ncbi:MAG TPA: hypothetical protein VNH39_01070 [Steroidobacteraceae bacterium]|jgi:hypothetical protein|nr:hypothetical protein [Steroidobacteraceae bacterium]HXI94994.1 hypothetical protein [Candidatus Acidoferrum sp.]
MALQTLGTNANTSLSALVWNGMATPTADVAAINALIKNDVNPRHPVAQIGGSGAFVKEGLLYVPNRGSDPLVLRPGDAVAVDSVSGQVILVTAYGLSAGPWHLV